MTTYLRAHADSTHEPRSSVVTGAFGYTGRHIARRLLAKGERVKSLTGHPDRPDPFDGLVAAAPLNFDRPADLAADMEGAATLYNTYWIRFERGALTFDRAVENCRTLFRAAEAAGVARIVHVSIANASSSSRLPYFRGKGLVEEALAAGGSSYAILRPTVVFGPEDILLNNIVWALRRFPAFPIFGSGEYRVQPVHVEDMARLSVEAGAGGDNATVDAAGPESYTFEELVRLLGEAAGARARLLHVGPGTGLLLTRATGLAVRDVVLTRDEIRGLMDGLLVSDQPPMGQTRLSEWARRNAPAMGRSFASELARHYR